MKWVYLTSIQVLTVADQDIHPGNNKFDYPIGQNLFLSVLGQYHSFKFQKVMNNIYMILI